MLWFGLMLGLWRTLRASKGTGIKPDYVVDLALYTVLAGIIGAHVGSILLDLPYFLKNPGEIASLWKGILSPTGGIRGLSFHAGLICALGVAALYARSRKLKFLDVTDLFSPGLVIGYSVTRIGCFLNGCCYGVPTSLPWGVRFCVDGGWTPPSHPAQLYAIAANVVIYFMLVRLERHRLFSGQVFFSYLCLYSVYRFMNEFVRKGVTAEVAFWGLTQAQVVSLVALLVFLPILIFKWRAATGKERK